MVAVPNLTLIFTQKTPQKILEFIKKNPRITRRELARLAGITEDGIKYNLNILQKSDLLKRIGPDKGGYWKVEKSNHRLT